MDGLTLRIRVRPGTSRTHVGGRYGDSDTLVVAVQARAVDGAANTAVIEALAEALGVPRRTVTIRSGHTSRSKVVHLDAVEAEVARLQAMLARLLAG